jgi:hypothetical protein
MEDLTEAELLSRAIDSRLGEVHTALPGKVESFNRTQQTVDVSPQVQIDGETLPVIPSVPVLYPRSGSSYLAFKINTGDTGLLIFCEADIGLWRTRGELGAPGDDGRHGIQGAVFLPGLYPANATLSIPSTVGGVAILESDDLRLGEWTATEAAVLGDLFVAAMKTWADAVTTAIPLGSDITVITTAFKTAIDQALSSIVKVK